MMADLDTQEPLSNLSDSSFVILGQGSLPPQLNTDDTSIKNDLNVSTDNLNTNMNLEYRNRSLKDRLSCSWMNGSFFSEEDIQKKLDELVKENYQLRETLSQNNLAIKSQLDTFFMWQQEVLKTHESHKEKFLETKDLILKLRAENMNLKKQLEDSFVPVVNDNEIYAQVHKKSEELEKLNKRIKEYEQMCNDLIEENNRLGIKNQGLKEELKVAENEMYKLKNDFENLKKENTYLRNKEQDRNNISFANKSLLNSEAHMLTQFNDKKVKILKLEEFNKSKSSNAETSKLGEAEQLNKCIDKLEDMNASLKMQNQRLNSFQSWVSIAEQNLKENKTNGGVECNLIHEINEMKSHLNQEESISREKQESIEELRKQFAELLDDYKALQLKLSFINKEKSFEFYTEEIHSLSAKLEAKDNELRLKQQECNNLKEEIEKLHSEETLLKFQMEQYKVDFMEERKSREMAVEEKENYAEKIRLLDSELKKIQQTAPEQNYISNTQLESSGNTEDIKCMHCFGNHDTRTCSMAEFDG